METINIKTAPAICPFAKCNCSDNANIIATGWDFEYATTHKEFPIAKCAQCHLVYLKDIPTPEEMQKIYPPNYYSFSESKSENILVKFVRDYLERIKGHKYQELLKLNTAHVVDIGCGDGRLLDILKKSCPLDWQFYGIEFEGPAINHVLKKGYKVKPGDIGALDISDWEEKFDLAMLHQVLEHTHYPQKILSKIRTMLKPGGILSLELPDIEAWDFKLFNKRYWGGYHIPRHFYLFNKQNIQELALMSGYEIISIKSILSPVFWIHSIHNRLVDSKYFSWLAKFSKPNNILFLSFFTVIEFIQVKFFGTSSNMQILLRKTNESSIADKDHD